MPLAVKIEKNRKRRRNEQIWGGDDMGMWVGLVEKERNKIK